MAFVETSTATADFVVSRRREKAPCVGQDVQTRYRVRTRSLPPVPDPLDDPVVAETLSHLDTPTEWVRTAQAEAQVNGSGIARELILKHCFTEGDYARSVALALGLPFETPASNDQPVGSQAVASGPFSTAMRTCNPFLETKVFLDPDLEHLGALKRNLIQNPQLRRRCRIATRSALREKMIAGSQADRFQAATLSLSRDQLHRSARFVMTGWQGAFIATSMLTTGSLMTLSVWDALLVFHLIAAVFFSAWLGLRFCAAWGKAEPLRAFEPVAGMTRLPVYTVVVALHQEHEVIERLIGNLNALNWPKSRIEIYLVCEEDDPSTFEPCRALTKAMPQFHVILVPPGEPRTKPKALNYVLPIASGEFLVLYDAEDEPHPQQLLEAYTRYRSSGEELACLQAPLVIRNGNRNWLTAIFAMEYAGLFRAFLPWLAHHRLPIPLGGTSNHFRVEALKQTGGWDSHNVTEDADLGMRLSRAGFDIGTISTPTFEDSPEMLSVWIKQRTRWLKGWFQTYAVHMRNPARLYQELGARRFATFQLVFHGMMSAALLLPIAVVLIVMTISFLWIADWPRSLQSSLLVMDLLILVCGFLSFLALAIRGSSAEELKDQLFALPMVPVYWGCVSFAAYRGLYKLVFDPHAWEKTPHGLASRADKQDPRYRIEPVFDI